MVPDEARSYCQVHTDVRDGRAEHAILAAAVEREATLIVLGVIVIIVEVNIARLIVTLPPLQIAMFLIAQLVGVSIGLAIISFAFPLPPEVADAAASAITQ